MKETRPRKNPIKEFKPDDLGFVMIPNASLLCEVDGEIDSFGRVHINRGLVGKKVKVLVYRD